MAYIYSAIPVGTEYYNAATDSVEQSGECWQIIEGTQTKIWSMDTSASPVPDSAAWRTLPNSGNWRRAGLSLLVAKIITRALNYPV